LGQNRNKFFSKGYKGNKLRWGRFPQRKVENMDYWCVTSSFDDSGRVAAEITNMVSGAEKPQNTFTSTLRKDIYNDWFESREAAEEYLEDVQEC